MIDKIIVTNGAALQAKYGTAGLAKVKKAVGALVAADKKRGIISLLVYLDSAADMKKFKGPAVTNASNCRQNKVAIDAIFKSANPEYLMILGAPDVVPHQDLKNPAFAGTGDPDTEAWGDLPYACDAPYSRDIATFKGPTRVVGRLPDLTGAKDPAHILALLKTAETYQSRPPKDYQNYFGLSTHSWLKSTELSLSEIFGNASAMHVAPPRNNPQTAAKLAPIAHFINCHGASVTPEYYGEKAGSMPISLTSLGIKKKIRPGTVATAECCYGAELYDSETLDLPLPISQHYLAQGAYGFFGSTTIAYGPADTNGVADLITQYFMLSALGGASLGRAALEARQRYVKQAGELDPIDLKTLGQFNLLGDPSIHPVKQESASSVPKGIAKKEAIQLERLGRRTKLREEGEQLKSKATAAKPAKGTKSPTVKKVLANIAQTAGIAKDTNFAAFSVTAPKLPGMAKNSKMNPVASRYYVAVTEPKGQNTKKKSRPPASTAIVVREVGGKIREYRIYAGKSWAPIATARKGPKT